jgi:hypothetical protein
MPLIEKISQMQRQGLTNEQIIQQLKEEGATPNDIHEALTQNQVKSAVSVGNNEMQPSVMAGGGATPTTEQLPPIPPASPQQAPITQQIPPAPTPSTAQQPPQFSPQQQAPQPPTPQEPEDYQQTSSLTQEMEYPEEAYGSDYPEYSEYAYNQPMDTEIITDISEQIVNEKLEKLRKQILETVKIKTELLGKVEDIDNRLNRIEQTINTLQVAILGKIGEYGENMADLKSEMELTQDSFSKILDPLSENIEKLRKIAKGKGSKTKKIKEEKEKKETKRGRRKKRSGFEHYLRK